MNSLPEYNNQDSAPGIDMLRHSIRENYRINEQVLVPILLSQVQLSSTSRKQIQNRAKVLIEHIRKQTAHAPGVDSLLNEFNLSGDEGVALMCLAESLLRIPDQSTCDELIRDKILKGDWSSHIGKNNTLFVNSSAWALFLTGKVVSHTPQHNASYLDKLNNVIKKLGEPVIRSALKYAIHIMGTQFVVGKELHDALDRSRSLIEKGYCFSYDMLGEGARTCNDADYYTQKYANAIEILGSNKVSENSGISIKLSALHPRYEQLQKARITEELLPRITKLVEKAYRNNVPITIDAEESARLDLSLDVFSSLFNLELLNNWNGLGLAVQAYQKRASFIIDWLIELARQKNKKINIRLVKGAYWDSEIKWSQIHGFSDYPVFTQKYHTDLNYLVCAEKLMSNRQYVYPQFATHNAYTVASIIELDSNGEGYEFQRLHGMGEALYDVILKEKKYQCRIYGPVGKHADLLAYLARRMLENGANTSFVNNIQDTKVDIHTLTIDPITLSLNNPVKRNKKIPIPQDLYQYNGSLRRNSKGLDINDPLELITLKKQISEFQSQYIPHTQIRSHTHILRNPANTTEIIGERTDLNKAELANLIKKADRAYQSWSKTDVQERASLLNQLAHEIEEQRNEFISLCIKEAGKTMEDSIAEVREAIDFCRYYSEEAIKLFSDNQYQPRGTVLCISPWNFPLAIFLGQITAALATGNTVIAKPAAQTTMIAQHALLAMQKVGLPEGVFNFATASGSVIGSALIPNDLIRAVLFTGSTEVGKYINRTLAKRKEIDLPLIAETGGQNAIIVDSSALPEQVVDDVITSSFKSAGQRCSACRVLFLQEEIYEKVCTMLKGAMNELYVGNPEYEYTDIGPVIDAQARQKLIDHTSYLNKLIEKTGSDRLRLINQTPLSSECDNGYFFPPTLYEIPDLSFLKEEIFGPVLHIIRYQENQLTNVLDQINATGFGLTLGIHSRIDHKASEIASIVHTGNVYINRNIVGAVVGVQPFGGRGLSGTGPKTGGPQYLKRLVSFKPPKTNSYKKEEISTHKIEANVIDNLISDSNSAFYKWKAVTVETRITLIEDIFLSLECNKEEKTALTHKCNQVIEYASSHWQAPKLMPGPTGERNELTTEPRGMVTVLIQENDSLSDWATCILGLLLSGNAVIVCSHLNWIPTLKQLKMHLDDQEQTDKCLHILEEKHVDQLINKETISSFFYLSESGRVKQVQNKIAKRSGPITPLLLHNNNTYLHNMVWEKTITINTSAVGGNTELITQN